VAGAASTNRTRLESKLWAKCGRCLMCEMNIWIELLVAIDSSSVQLNTIRWSAWFQAETGEMQYVNNEIRKKYYQGKRMFAATLQRLEVMTGEK
jgi:hypothetical protein